YAGRYAGTIAAPPRTLARQTVVVNQLRQRTTNIREIRNTTVLAPLSGVRGTALSRISRDERVRYQQSASRLGTATRERSRFERDLLSRRAAPVRPGAAPRAVSLDPQRGRPAPPANV